MFYRWKSYTFPAFRPYIMYWNSSYKCRAVVTTFIWILFWESNKYDYRPTIVLDAWKCGNIIHVDRAQWYGQYPW